MRNLDWNLLKSFEGIAAAGNISRAATLLARKQPTISLALKRLEIHLGVRLCERGPSNFKLTPEGEAVAAICDQIGRLVMQLPEQVAEQGADLKGRLRVCLISKIGSTSLDDAIHYFHRRYPLVELDLTIGSWEALPDLLLRNELDVGIGPVKFTHNSLRYDLLFEEVQRVYCGASHEFFGRLVDNIEDMTDQAFVLRRPGEPEEITQFRTKHGLGNIVSGVCDHVEEMQRLVRLGIGLAFLPVPATNDDLEMQRLWCLTPKRQTPSIQVFVISNPMAPVHRVRDLFLAELHELIM